MGLGLAWAVSLCCLLAPKRNCFTTGSSCWLQSVGSQRNLFKTNFSGELTSTCQVFTVGKLPLNLNPNTSKYAIKSAFIPQMGLFCSFGYSQQNEPPHGNFYAVGRKSTFLSLKKKSHKWAYIIIWAIRNKMSPHTEIFTR